MSKNHEGYSDPTASKAIGRIKDISEVWPSVGDDARKVKGTVKIIKTVLDVMGYELVNRLELKDIKTGKVHK